MWSLLIPNDLSFALESMSYHAFDHWIPETLTDITDL